MHVCIHTNTRWNRMQKEKRHSMKGSDEERDRKIWNHFKSQL